MSCRGAEQIELTRLAVRKAMNGRWARHGHLPYSCREIPMLRSNPAIAMVRPRRTSPPAATSPSIERRNLDLGRRANTPGRAGRPIEHPGRNLQPSPGGGTRPAAPENLSARLLDHLMNVNPTAGQRMPPIKKLVFCDSCGRSFVVLYNEARTHLSVNKDAPSPRPTETSSSVRASLNSDRHNGQSLK